MPANSRWPGYVLLRKPASVSEVDWGIVLQALKQQLGRREGSSRPNWRLHWRLSLDGHKAIIEGMFDLGDLDPQDLTRFCRLVSEALDGRLTPGEVRAAFGGSVRVFAQGQPWSHSNSMARSYMAQALEEWEDV
jgi:hypothetical protein